jgi:hypothetical protein
MGIAVPRPVAIASTLLWFAGALLIFLSASSIFYVTSPKSAASAADAPLLLMLWGAAYLCGGFALRRKRWGYRWWAAGLCLSAVGAVFVFLAPMTIIVLLLSAAALALLALEWRRPT